MTAFVLLAIVIGLIAAAWSTRPLWWPAGTDGKPSTMLAAVLAVFMFGIASGGYVALGSPGHLLPRAAAPIAAAGGGAEDAERTQALQQIAGMVDQLAERLKTRPDDAEGWQMLARSYAAIGRHADAVGAFRKATQLRPDDAGLLADFAFTVAVANNRSFDGEPTALVERALKIDPRNAKALALAGTVAFDRKDYRVAVQHWERLAQLESGDGQLAEQIRASIAQARQLAGMPAAPPPAGVAAAPAPPTTAGNTAPAKVSGTVSLAQPLKGRVAPEDTVFVFARAAEGNRVPLAIVRKQVKDLPLQFTLDDSMAMSPAAKLSGASSVIVGARISKSGDAMPKSGDLQGLSPAVAVGTSGIKLEINEELKR